MKRLAIISTHPIQYNAPLFRLLNDRGNVALKVFYTLESKAVEFDREFGKKIEWDVPLLEGYEYEFVSNGGNTKRSFFDVKNPGLERQIASWKPDAVMFFGWNFFSHLRSMRHFKNKIPVYFRGDSTDLNPLSTTKKMLRGMLLKFVYSNVDKAFYVGSNNKDYYRLAGLKDEQLIYAPHAVDNNRFSASAKSMNDQALSLRKSLSISDDEVVFVYAGKFYNLKNPELLVRAFAALNNPGAHLVMVGDGILKEKLVEIARGNNRIHFLPFQNQSRMPMIYQFCDVFCLPSLSETWGLSINEAMACGKAVLVSDRVGCAVDLVEKDVNGLIFRSGDQKELLSALGKMVDLSLVSRMGNASLKKIEVFTFERIAETFENTLITESN